MKKIITFLAALIILLHVLAFSIDTIGIDQLIPCILGYLTVWVIFMMIEFKPEEPFEDDSFETPDEYNH